MRLIYQSMSHLLRHRGRLAATSPLPERSSEVSPYRRPSRCHISASPKLKAVGLLNGRDASGRDPRSESVAFGLSKNEYYDPHSVRRLCIVKLIA